MCGKCIILTYDEVLGIVQEIEVSAPLGMVPEWPARPAQLAGGVKAVGSRGRIGQTAFPNSAAPLIVLGGEGCRSSCFDSREGAGRSPLACGEEGGLSLAAPGGSPFVVPDGPSCAAPGGSLSVTPGGPFSTSSDGPAPLPPFVPGGLQVRQMCWGFQESWKAGVVFNTRIESAGKPLWRDSMEHRRCIIPVRSFFETSATETVPSPRTGRPVKRPYEFAMPGCDVTFIGGVWKGDRFSMVTTEANRWMAPVHHRMPLVLRPNELGAWLGPDYLRLADRSTVELEVCASEAPEPPGSVEPAKNRAAKGSRSRSRTIQSANQPTLFDNL